jgi:hypothetical protein
MTNEQPEALRLADALEQGIYLLSVERDATAAELRRQHAEIERLQEQKVRFKCTVVDDQHPNGVPLKQWGNASQRQWVGLTRNEAMEIINSLAGQDWIYAVDAIESKLKEKNGGNA